MSTLRDLAQMQADLQVRSVTPRAAIMSHDDRSLNRAASNGVDHKLPNTSSKDDKTTGDRVEPRPIMTQRHAGSPAVTTIHPAI